MKPHAFNEIKQAILLLHVFQFAHERLNMAESIMHAS